jgi:serine/threonine protein kinase
MSEILTPTENCNIRFVASLAEEGSMESVTSEPTLHVLLFKEGAAVEALVDYGGFRYHLLVQYNETDNHCIENSLLRKVYEALDAEDDGALDEATNACIMLVKPFMAADYIKRAESNEAPSGTIKLRAVTERGTVCVTNHTSHLEYPPASAVENEYPGLATVPSTVVEKQEAIDDDIFKVKVRDKIYCLKSVHRNINERGFKREIKILQQCSHPNIISLIYLVTDAHDKIEAMLLEYVANARPLSTVVSLSGDQYDQWTKQIREAITYLHNENIVWGDAKPGNVLIREDDSVVLIDFGGGHTKGWVDHQNYETVRGDWQGYERTVQFLKSKME